MNKKLLAIVGVVSLVVLTLVGVGGYYGYTKFIKPATAFASATEEMNNFKSAEFDIEQSFSMEMEFIGEYEGLIPNETLDAVQSGEGKIDTDSESMYIKMMSKLGDDESTEEYYIIGDTFYMVVDGDVTEMPLSEAAGLGDFDTVDSFKENQIWTTISTGIDFEYVGETTFEGVEVFEYKVNVTDENLKAFNDGIQTGFASGFGEDADVKYGISDKSQIVYKVFVSKSDNKPVGETLLIPSITIEVVDMVKVTIKDLDMKMVYTGVNGEVKIEAPQN